MPGRAELKCKLYPFGSLPDLRFVIICSLYQGKYMLSMHKKRATWETQGGHIELNETPLEAARRELYEESGVKEATFIPLCDYYGYDDTGWAHGAVFLANIHKLETLPLYEMKRVELFDELPNNLTYPNVTPILYEKAKLLARELSLRIE